MITRSANDDGPSYCCPPGTGCNRDYPTDPYERSMLVQCAHFGCHEWVSEVVYYCATHYPKTQIATLRAALATDAGDR